MRLIDADALVHDLIHNRSFYPVCVWRAIEDAPTIDAAPVVRCKDCIYYKTGEYFKDMKFCFRLKHPGKNKQVGYNYPEDGFCNYGERKET